MRKVQQVATLSVALTLAMFGTMAWADTLAVIDNTNPAGDPILEGTYSLAVYHDNLDAAYVAQVKM